MLEFTSALYLGFRHASPSLQPWSGLTTGSPAALGVPAQARAVAAALAGLQGCERATLAPSTLHLFWDLFTALGDERLSVFVDRGAYPIARWGVERAAANGLPTRSFAHHDPAALRKELLAAAPAGRRPLVVADGYCPGCGVTPLRAYYELARSFGGWLVVDDTQSLGLLGAHPVPNLPLGLGGGGSLRYHGIVGTDAIVGASLAKAFGVPVAVLSGGGAVIELFEQRAETRVYCSPPSAAVLAAAQHALADNAHSGDALRGRLTALVRRFRTQVSRIGLCPHGGLFPVQSFHLGTGPTAVRTYERLLELGIAAVIHRGHEPGQLVISFLITTEHTDADLDRAASALAWATLRRHRPSPGHTGGIVRALERRP